MDLFDKISDKIKRHNLKKRMEKVDEDYQISEREGKLWLTFFGCPVVPEDLLSVNIIKALKEIRQKQYCR